MSKLSFPTIRARQIAASDTGAVADLLTKGFRRRRRRHWVEVLNRLGEHPAPTGLPTYGYMMEHGGVPVGVILVISTTAWTPAGGVLRSNLSSWYVEPAFRSHAPLLIGLALRRKDVTYVNISPAPHTRPIIEAQGFSRYGNGLFVASTLPVLRRRREGRTVEATIVPDAPFEPFERDVLLDHARYGCMSFWWATAERAYPFVFRRRYVKRLVPCAQLIYCRDLEDCVAFARPVGGYLARRGAPLMVLDANGPLRGLAGLYLDNVGPKYFKGPAAPRLGDLAYTEAAMFGI